jgi:hypothetical protein
MWSFESFLSTYFVSLNYLLESFFSKAAISIAIRIKSVSLHSKLKFSYMNSYETVFILTPVLSEEQAKEAVKKFEGEISS